MTAAPVTAVPAVPAVPAASRTTDGTGTGTGTETIAIGLPTTLAGTPGSPWAEAGRGGCGPRGGAPAPSS
ncbi:hypothetical protein [Planomonospora sp. ID82291]|uniref:hypothetical protein n=1 Tax=Planomonospora sp. ID82291 TaxID=2738136 RepID=UPI0018C3FD9F|nr:hypothetical protein [Planomonospora sp. ID82291]MBG0817326.1 hypothetical protein [Planomonospora sp. ID82291]